MEANRRSPQIRGTSADEHIAAGYFITESVVPDNKIGKKLVKATLENIVRIGELQLGIDLPGDPVAFVP